MKETARKMMRMVDQINKNNFAGQRLLTCYSCHNGDERPKLIPTLDGIYDPPPLPQPDVITQGPASPTADQILDKYLQALGGAQRLAALHQLRRQGYGSRSRRARYESSGNLCAGSRAAQHDRPDDERRDHHRVRW